MMKGGRRAVFCYGQRVWSKRIEFRRALTLLVEASAGECRIAKGSTTTRQARMQAYLGQASWQLRLVQRFGLKFCERATAAPSRAAVEPLVTKSEISTRWLASVCACAVRAYLLYRCVVCMPVSPTTDACREHAQAAGQKSRHAFAQQPVAGFAPSKHRGEMLCFAGLRALVDGKKPRSVV